MFARNTVRFSRAAGRCTLNSRSPVIRVAILPKNSSRMYTSICSQLAAKDGLPQMSCFQCEQTRDGKGCVTDAGVCGKDSDVAALQDLLVATLEEIGYAITKSTANSPFSKKDTQDMEFVLGSLFTTLTNVNFDGKRILEQIEQARDILQSRGSYFPLPPKGSELTSYIEAARKVGVAQALKDLGEDVGGLREMVVYGIKGAAAYAHHAHMMGWRDATVLKDFAKILATVAPRTKEGGSADLGTLLNAALSLGEVNLRIMTALENEHKAHYGTPSPHAASLGQKKGKSILVSGHDLHDLASLLEATKDKGINVYTHGEMLPAHGYPELRKYPNLAGHYGTAWQNQKFEFATFPGAIVLTSNCLMPPMKSYKSRLFTKQAVGFDGVRHIKEGDNWEEVIAEANKAKGFEKDIQGTALTVGVGADYILANAPAVLDAVKSGAVKSFFVIGGCDGAEAERSYFTDLACSTPDTSVILTLGCAKYRFNKKLEGQKVGPFPKVMDLGQCNDSMGALRVALALTQALGKSHPNELPIYYGISWLEQKAAAVLCTMLHLNIKNIHLGPSLPAFLSPNVLKVLVEKFGIGPTTSPKGDFGAQLADLKV